MYKLFYYHNMNKYWIKKIVVPDEKMFNLFAYAYFCCFFFVFLLFDFLFSSP